MEWSQVGKHTPLGKIIDNYFRKNSQNIIDYFTKNFDAEKDLSVVEGVRLASRPLCENVDNPRQNIEVCVITQGGIKFLNEDQMETLISTIEKDIATEQEDK